MKPVTTIAADCERILSIPEIPDVNVPVGSTARVEIPNEAADYIINGKSQKVSEAVMEIESGKYSLSWELKQ